ncbi:hypothetical protein ACFQY0_07050 [Haloferula chungangensis]|uniref:Transporter n=1 Tax=Haloferula chungangensis TaxID=1048331 RepID=A0ABW2L3K1_9BACT
MHRFAITFLTLAQAAHAHHGQDFFVNLDAQVPVLGSVSTFATASYVRTASGSEETSLEPGFLVGTGLGTSVGLSATWSNDDGVPFNYSGFTPLFQWSMAIPDSPLRIGFSASYHISDSSSQASSSASGGHSHGSFATNSSSSSTGSSSVSFNPDAPAFNPDAPPSGGSGHDHSAHDHSHGSHSGIHRHGEDFFASRLIIEWQATESTRAVANLIVVSGGWSDIAFGYSLGLRHDFTEKWALGLESIGDLDSGGEHEIVAGAWFTPRHDLNFRLGAGTGIGQGSPELSLYSGLTWRF